MTDGDDQFLGRELDGRFRLDSLIGEGGMGRVYRGCQLSVDRGVAIKVLHGELSLNDELQERFFREAKVVSDLSHPHIVRLIDFGRDEETGLMYLVMDLVEGFGLDELIERGRLKPQLALTVAHQTCGALVEAHGAGVIHRDMKAENLLLEPVSDGTLQSKIVDFGIAYPRETSDRLTMTGRVYGTASYMAPEQAQGEEVDERADLFSLGIMMFEMLVGRLPIEGANSMQVLIRQIQEGPPRLSDVAPSEVVPDDVADLVDRLTATEPADRPDSTADVREELDTILERKSWGPLRLESDADGVAMFDPWIAPPLDFRDETAAGRKADPDPVPTEDGPGRTIEPPPEKETVGATPDRLAADGGMRGDDDRDGNRLLVLAAIAIGLVVLGGVVVGGYAAIQYFRPEADGLDEVARPGVGAESAPSDDEETAPDEGASAPETDPVCGDIERDPIPDNWRGTYRPKGDDADDRLKVWNDRLNLRWADTGVTFVLAQTVRDGRTYSVECARRVGAEDAASCSGTLRKAGPVLTVDWDGSEVCESRLSRSWMAE